VQNDANDIRSTLNSPSHCGYDPANVRFLLDADATLAEIRAGLSWLATVAGQMICGGLFLWTWRSLAKFGGYESPAHPVDADTRFGRVELIRDGAVDALKVHQVSEALILIDACHSAGPSC